MGELAPASPAAMTFRAFLAAFWLAARRLTRSKFFIGGVCLSLIPILIAILRAYMVIIRHHPERGTLDLAHLISEMMLRTLHLQIVVFIVGAFFGFAVMRQETDDETLHYLFLQPISRLALVLGKFAASLSLASLVCVASLWLTYFVLALPVRDFPAVFDDFARQGRALILIKESCVLVLALLVYISIAMLAGSIFKSALCFIFLGLWEAALPYLPFTLKFFCITHYLHSMLPVRMSEQRKLFEMLGEPAPLGHCLSVIFGLSMTCIAICVILFQTRECHYKQAE